MSKTVGEKLNTLVRMVAFAALFFLSIDLMGGGMKASFKEPLKHFLHDHAADFTSLVSFVIGILGTSLVQSSSTVTSMAVLLTQDAILPVAIAIGIVHGANLGTSVTSTIVAFFADAPSFQGNPFTWMRDMLFKRRSAGFRRAVATAIVHGMFNVIVVTAILLMMELPFGLIDRMAAASAMSIAEVTSATSGVVVVFDYIKPSAYTKPVVKALLGAGLPGWGSVLLGFAVMFGSLKGFSNTVSRALVADGERLDARIIGEKLLGKTPFDTFVRGLVLTIMVQSSSATTSMIVPLAAMGFFSLRQVLPFIMGANIGTTTTGILAASSGIGEPGFEAAMTIALCHFYLNTTAVILVATLPPLRTSIIGATEMVAAAADRAPAVLAAYLATLSIGVPVVVFLLPTVVAAAFLGSIVLFLLVAPHIWLRSNDTTEQVAEASEGALAA
ncbi:MAG: Na/Pi symporter [Proteobacteria bacterium]|nr:Na/Pi symporter [Pseudomonadota bacterium]